MNQDSMLMEKHGLTYLIKSDLYRYHGTVSIKLFLKELVFGIGFKYTFWLRLCHYLKKQGRAYHLLFRLCYLMLRRCMFKYGIQIAYDATIGPGFYIGHFGTIIVSPDAVIGKNCNISQGVTIGMTVRGTRKGSPTIGDNVFIAPGAKIIGKISVGDNVAVGANAVVTRDVEPGMVVAGVPAKVISNNGSRGYVCRTDYDRVLLRNSSGTA